MLSPTTQMLLLGAVTTAGGVQVVQGAVHSVVPLRPSPPPTTSEPESTRVNKQAI